MLETDEEANHESGEKNETSEGTEFGDEFSEVVEFDLKRSILSVSLKSCCM